MLKEAFLAALQKEFPFVKDINGRKGYRNTDLKKVAFLEIFTDIPKPQDSIRLFAPTISPWTTKALAMLIELLPELYKERRDAYDIWYKPKE
jgi:hypothetical protein